MLVSVPPLERGRDWQVVILFGLAGEHHSQQNKCPWLSTLQGFGPGRTQAHEVASADQASCRTEGMRKAVMEYLIQLTMVCEEIPTDRLACPDCGNNTCQTPRPTERSTQEVSKAAVEDWCSD